MERSRYKIYFTNVIELTAIMWHLAMYAKFSLEVGCLRVTKREQVLHATKALPMIDGLIQNQNRKIVSSIERYQYNGTYSKSFIKRTT